jgi:hypothetical protein
MPKNVKSRTPSASRRYQLIEVGDLTGGLDLRRSPSLLASDRSRTLKNFALTNPGELVVRPGYRQFSTTNLGNFRIQGGQRIYLTSTTATRLAWNGAVYSLTDGGVLDSTAVYSTISSTNQVFFPHDRELVAVMDGVNRPRKSTDAVTWTLMGIEAGSSSCVLSSVGGGSLSSAEFEVAATFKDRGTGFESNGTTGSTITLGATGAIAVTVSNSTDAQVEAIVLYARNKTAGETVLRKISSAAMQGGAGANSTYTITSSNWSANAEIPTNHNVPDAFKFAVPWKNRWWAAHPTVGNRIHFTELFLNQAWPILFFIDIPFERGDSITALVPQGDTLLVFGQSKVFLIIGQTSLDFEVRPSAGAQAGCLGPRAAIAIENGVIHASAEGVFIFDGATDKYLGFDIETGWRDLIGNTAASDLSNVAVVYHFTQKELRIAVPRLYPTGVVGEWILDLNRTREQEEPAWTSTDRTIGGYILFAGNEATVGQRGFLLSWHNSTQGTVWTESTGTTANSSNMTAEYEGPDFSMGIHRARLIDVRGEYEPHGGAFSIEPIVDGVSQGVQSVTIGSGLAVYGTAVYGTGVYAGSGRRMFHVMQPLGAEGRTLRLKQTYVGQEAFRMFSYQMSFVPESMPRGFSE